MPHPYRPDDAGITRAALAFLQTPAGIDLRQRVAALPGEGRDASVAQVVALRKHFPQDALHAALTIGRMQPGAREKFPNLAHDYIYLVPEALEQATDFAVAIHKAARFANLKPGSIYDLCAGIGGDALALAPIAETIAVDMSEVRLWCLRYNFHEKIQTICADVTAFAATEFTDRDATRRHAYFHIDPARRTGGKRSRRYEDLIPGPEFIEKLIDAYAGGAIKLSPAVDFDSLPLQAGGGHLEIISHHKSVVQAVLWTGAIAARFPSGTRTATHLSSGKPFTYTALPALPLIPPLPFPPGPIAIPFTLYELDGAVTRAGLAAPFAVANDLVPLTSDGGYLLSTDATLHKTCLVLTPFILHAFYPFSESRIAAALRELAPRLPAGAVEVKSRGNPRGVDTDHLQLSWTKSTPVRATVLLFPHGKDVYAAIASRP